MFLIILKLKNGIYADEKLLYPARYVPDQYKTQQMYDKAILENGGTLKSILDC